MGIFDSIKKAIFGEAKAETVAPTQDGQAAGTAGTATPAPAPSTAASPAIDVTAILDDAVRASGQKLDWKHSIVDLLKALKIDSSFASRKALAAELGYTGDANDSAAMNIWLHKAVVKKLSENGSKVPAELLD